MAAKARFLGEDLEGPPEDLRAARAGVAAQAGSARPAAATASRQSLLGYGELAITEPSAGSRTGKRRASLPARHLPSMYRSEK